MRIDRIGIAAAAALAAMPLLAAGSAVTFAVADKPLVMPVPQGYCLPKGLTAEITEKTALIDQDNATLASFVDCKGNGTQAAMANYVLVKAPNAAAKFTLGKDEALDMLDSVGRAPNAPKFDEAMSDRVADKTEDAIGQRVELTGTVGYSGRDKDCVYLGGRLALKQDPNGKSLLLAGCMTVVGGKVLTIYRYDARPGAKIADLKAHARLVALSIHE